jgi:hypothetical protein
MKIVTGMHRSGTSFLSQALHHLGADFGPPDLLFPADHWNQNGYFENIEVVSLNNKIILGNNANIEYWLDAPEHGFKRTINSLRSRKWKYFLFPSRKGIAKRGARHFSSLRAVHDQYRNQYVKDPRFCLTLAAWKAAGPVNDIIFSFRNPTAVADSIWRRERLPRSFGYRYWLYHIENFFVSLDEDTPISLVNFDAFFSAETQESAFQRLVHFVDAKDLDGRVRSLSSILDVKLRTAVPLSQDAPRKVQAVYNALLLLMQEHGAAKTSKADFYGALKSATEGHIVSSVA